jgi:hypothetical protein
VQAPRSYLPADLEAGSTARAAANGATSTVAVGDHLDPQCIPALVVRGVAGRAQRIQAACSVPEAAVVNPGSSKITHEPASISVRVRDMVGLSVVTLISVPARTLLAVWVYSLLLRLRTTGG